MLESEHASDEASYSCAAFNIVSFNVGMHQGMVTSSRARPDGFGANSHAVMSGKHSRFARHMEVVGGTKQICQQHCLSACWKSCLRQRTPIEASQHPLQWTTYQLSIRDASQFAGVPIYLVAGNFHIRVPTNGTAPALPTRRRLTQLCLHYLAGLAE